MRITRMRAHALTHALTHAPASHSRRRACGRAGGDAKRSRREGVRGRHGAQLRRGRARLWCSRSAGHRPLSRGRATNGTETRNCNGKTFQGNPSTRQGPTARGTTAKPLAGERTCSEHKRPSRQSATGVSPSAHIAERAQRGGQPRRQPVAAQPVVIRAVILVGVLVVVVVALTVVVWALTLVGVRVVVLVVALLVAVFG